MFMRIVKTYVYSHEAHLDLAKLQDEGIQVRLMDDNIVSIDPLLAQAVGGIKLLVDEEDFERAKAILNENDFQDLIDEFSADELKRQNKCPLCGSVKIYQKRSLWSGLLYLIVFFTPVALRKKTYYCLECSNQWKE